MRIMARVGSKFWLNVLGAYACSTRSGRSLGFVVDADDAGVPDEAADPEEPAPLAPVDPVSVLIDWVRSAEVSPEELALDEPAPAAVEPAEPEPDDEHPVTTRASAASALSATRVERRRNGKDLMPNGALRRGTDERRSGLKAAAVQRPAGPDHPRIG
jgi:hypothetical protein